MAVRQDRIQLNVEVITDEQRNLAKTNTDTKALTQELRKTIKAGGDVADVMRRIEAAGAKVEDIDLTKVAPQQLITRARQLKQVLDQLPASAPQAAKLRAEYKRINDRLADIRQETRGVATALGKGRGGLVGRLTGALAVIGAVVAAFRGLFSVVSDGVKRAADFEQLNVALSTFLGSAEKAQQVIEELNQFSIATPFDPEQVNRAGKALLAFGIEQEELIPLLTKVGDVAAGTGKDFNELVLIVGKARAAGRIQGEELNQLAEAGIPIYDELAKVTGAAAEDIRKLGEQGKLSFEDLEAVFTNLTSEGGRFNGLLEKQSKTLSGLASTAQGALGALSRNIAGAFTPLIKTILPPVIDLINRISERVAPLAQFIGGKLVQAFRFLQGVFSPLLESIQRLGASLASVSDGTGRFSAIVRLLGSALALVVNVVSSVIARVAQLFEVFGQFGGGSDGFFARIFVQPLSTAIEFLTQFIAVLNGLVTASRVAFDSIGSIGDVFSNTIGLAFDKIKGLFTDNQAAIDARRASLAGAYQKLGTSIGEAFTRGYEEALGTTPVPTELGGGGGSGAAPRPPASPLPPKDPELTEADKRAAEAAGKAAAEAEAKRRQEIQDARAGDVTGEIEGVDYNEEEELARAQLFADRLGDIDEDLVNRRIELAEREARVKEELNNYIVSNATQATEDIIGLLGRDEEARKKNAAVLKAFQKGQAIVAGLQEVQQIRTATAAQAASAGPLAPVVFALGVVRTALAVARTATTIGKINATKFARGGTPRFGQFGGKPHSAGGTRGVFDDGTQIEVERGETFAIVNKNAQGLLGFLSDVNQRTGGVAFARGGIALGAAPSTTPVVSSATLAASAAAIPDQSALLSRLDRLTEVTATMQTRFRAVVVTSDLDEANADEAAARSASEV